MPWVESLTDPQELRRRIRDLVALSTLPAIWTRYNPRQITETSRVGKAIASDSGKIIPTALRDAWLGQSEQMGVIANPFGEGAIRVASAPIGFRGDAVIVAGSQQPSFPTGVQRLLLSIGANGTTIALQRWSAETVEERFVSLV